MQFVGFSEIIKKCASIEDEWYSEKIQKIYERKIKMIDGNASDFIDKITFQ